MSKRTEPRNKIDRRLGCNLWEKLNHLSIGENMGQDNTEQKEKKLSDYGIQLFAKQKLKGYYGFIRKAI